MDYRIRWQRQRRQRQRKRLLIVPAALVLAVLLYALLHSLGGGGRTYWVHQGPPQMVPHLVAAPSLVYAVWGDGHIEAIRSRDGVSSGSRYFFSVPEAFEATPTIARHILYVGSDLGVLRALDARTGQLLWQRETGAPLRCQPLVADGRLYVGNESGWLYCFMLGGTKVWARQLEDGLSGQPALVGGLLIAATTRGVVRALDPATGRPVWRRDLQTPVYAPVKAAPPLVLVGSDSGYLNLLQASNGAMWPPFFTRGLLRRTPAVSDRVIAFGSTDGWLRVVNRNGNEPLWAYRLPGPITAGPVIRKGYAYVACPSRLLAFAEDSGRLIRSWKGEGFAGDLVVTDAAIYIGTSAGQVMALVTP